METFSSQNVPAAIGPYSQAVITGNLIYTSGQIPIDPITGQVIQGGIVEQTEQVLKNINTLLEDAGTSLVKVVKTTCFLTDMSFFNEFNKIYSKYFTGAPARSCVAVKGLPKGVLIEIEVIAEL